MNMPDTVALGDAKAAFEMWGTWSQHVESWAGAPDSSLLVVRYEDLMSKPTKTFTAVLKHLRQPHKPDQVAEAIELSSFDTLQRLEDQYGFHERPRTAEPFFVSGKAGSWRENLTSAQAEAIVDAHGPLMKRFGYFA